jgi:hypothetical protein
MAKKPKKTAYSCWTDSIPFEIYQALDEVDAAVQFSKDYEVGVDDNGIAIVYVAPASAMTRVQINIERAYVGTKLT